MDEQIEEQILDWKYSSLNSINFENYYNKSIIGINVICFVEASKQKKILIVDDGFLLINLQLNQNGNNASLWDYQGDLDKLKVAVAIVDTEIKAKCCADYIRQKYSFKPQGKTYAKCNFGVTQCNLPVFD
jgi:hypothetical protein